MFGVVGNGDKMFNSFCNKLLHSDKRVPPQVFHLFYKGSCAVYGNSSVHCDGVVDGGRDRNSFCKGEEAVAQALVIVDDIVVIESVFKVFICPYAKGHGFGISHG